MLLLKNLKLKKTIDTNFCKCNLNGTQLLFLERLDFKIIIDISLYICIMSGIQVLRVESILKSRVPTNIYMCTCILNGIQVLRIKRLNVKKFKCLMAFFNLYTLSGYADVKG